MRRHALFAVAALWIAGTIGVGTWGPEGHEAVATVAEQYLTADVRAAVNDLLVGESMASVSVWADDVRNDRPETYNWHFVNIPLSGNGNYDPNRDCQPTARGDCVVNALTRLERDLADTTLQKEHRREALMFIIHFIGDLHQPLHSVDDVGGNRVRVAEIGGATNLHAAWDGGIIRARGLSADDLVSAANTILSHEDDHPIAINFADWAIESHRIGKTVAYPQAADGEISESEVAVDVPIIEEQIARGGIRSAAVLNRSLAVSAGAK